MCITQDPDGTIQVLSADLNMYYKRNRFYNPSPNRLIYRIRNWWSSLRGQPPTEYRLEWQLAVSSGLLWVLCSKEHKREMMELGANGVPADIQIFFIPQYHGGSPYHLFLRVVRIMVAGEEVDWKANSLTVSRWLAEEYQ